MELTSETKENLIVLTLFEGAQKCALPVQARQHFTCGKGRLSDLVPDFRDELFPTNLRSLFFLSIHAGLNAVKTPRRCTPSR